MSELDAYDYDLPRELIAQHPASPRSAARLLVARRAEQRLEHARVGDLPDILSHGDCLVLNDTRVTPARLVGRRERTGGRWEGLFLRQDAHGRWLVLAKTRGKPQPGEVVVARDRRGRDALRLTLVDKFADGTWAALPDAEGSAFDILDRVGRVPLPPYIRGGEMAPTDRETYQTVYAQEPGSAAAPTAGLHFTEELLATLAARGVERCQVTLHVGLGTFRPVTVERLADHAMHFEWGRVTPAAVEQLRRCRAAGGRVVAVGTTSTRVLETAAMSGALAAWEGETNLFIRPPHTFRAIDALMTNFHLPKSTLLVLVRVFGGDELIRAAYAEAIAHKYRFYSYGDAMLIL